MFTLRGERIKVLGPEDLFIPQTAEGCAVSDVVDDTLYFFLKGSLNRQIHSYKVSEKF